MTFRQPEKDALRALNSTPPVKPRVIGLIPAAGRATRLGKIASSKEVMPAGREQRPVAEYLVDQMRGAGADLIYFILRDGKWDIPAHFGDGERQQVPIGYLMMNAPWGPPFTLNQATPYLNDANVLVGFPDILLSPSNAFQSALSTLDDTGADAVLGTFSARQKDGCDLVTFDNNHKVTAVIPKENSPQWHDDSVAWLFAVWTPAFTRYFSNEVNKLEKQAQAMPAQPQPEWPVGTILDNAVADGMDIRSVHFEKGQFLDIGEPDRLLQATSFPDTD
jgi:glucose-1-phosphate thymidylyltransferase